MSFSTYIRILLNFLQIFNKTNLIFVMAKYTPDYISIFAFYGGVVCQNVYRYIGTTNSHLIFIFFTTLFFHFFYLFHTLISCHILQHFLWVLSRNNIAVDAVEILRFDIEKKKEKEKIEIKEN